MEDTLVSSAVDGIAGKKHLDQTAQKINYQKFFRYTNNGNYDKIGICLVCEKKGVKKVIKRTNSGTTGMKYHLKKYHQNEYEILFGTKSTTSPHNKLPANQRTLDCFTNVSINFS